MLHGWRGEANDPSDRTRYVCHAFYRKSFDERLKGSDNQRRKNRPASWKSWPNFFLRTNERDKRHELNACIISLTLNTPHARLAREENKREDFTLPLILKFELDIKYSSKSFHTQIDLFSHPLDSSNRFDRFSIGWNGRLTGKRKNASCLLRCWRRRDGINERSPRGKLFKGSNVRFPPPGGNEEREREREWSVEEVVGRGGSGVSIVYRAISIVRELCTIRADTSVYIPYTSSSSHTLTHPALYPPMLLPLLLRNN